MRLLQQMDRPSRKPEVSTYALRYVRRLLLKRLCSEGHPVLNVENYLISDAAKAIRKAGMSGQEVIKIVKRMAIGKILMLSEGDDIRSELIEEVNSDRFDDLTEKN